MRNAHDRGGKDKSLLKCLYTIHHVKVRTCGIFDNLRRTSARPQLVLHPLDSGPFHLQLKLNALCIQKKSRYLLNDKVELI